MRNSLKIYLILLFALFISSCNWIDTGLNTDPDQPADVPMELLLPSIQASSGYNIGGNTAVRTTNIWMQYFAGIDRQSLREERYQLASADVNNFWENTYSQAMMDCKKLIEKAELQNSPHYAGIAKVMLALNLGTATNFFGDIPYTEAFDGSNDLLQPAFDSQESIYASIDALLAEAITDLEQEENAVAVSSDLIYEGDIAMWIKAANALRARYTFYTGGDVSAYLADAFAPGEDFSLGFESGANQNPIYQFMRDRTDIRMNSTFMNMLIANSDPRLPFYAAVDENGGYSGCDPGSQNSNTSWPGTYNASETSPVVFSSYAEMKFIEAETTMSLAAWQEGVEWSVRAVTGKLGLDELTNADSLWLDANVWTVSSIDLELIIVEKYKAMYSTVVAWDDYRRTGFPVLETVKDAIYDAVPLRYPYPQSEITYNENCPVNVDPFSSLWIFQ